MTLLGKDQLLAKAATLQLRREVVTIPELGGDITVQEMSGRDRDEWEASNWRQKGDRRFMNLDNMRARLAVRCIVDEQGQRLFTNSDADLLGTWPASILDQVFAASQRVSGVSDGDLAELKKTSDAMSGSDSPTS